MTDFTENDDADSFLEEFRSSLTDEQRRGGEIMRNVANKYLRTARDKRLEADLYCFVDLAIGDGKRRPEGRAFAVVGESGVGKTWALRRLTNRPVFRQRGDKLPLLAVTAPKPCTLKQLGRKILHALDYPLEANLLEHITWERVRTQLKLRDVWFVWIDEMHHALQGADEKVLRETLKNVMQQTDHPVNFILSGTPELFPFLDDDYQFFRRKELVLFDMLSFPDDVTKLRFIVEEIVLRHAGLEVAPDLRLDEFSARLCHAAAKRFGMVISLTRNAVKNAVYKPGGIGAVGVEDFAHAYHELSGADSSMNVFLARDWSVIDTRSLAIPDDDNAYEAQAAKPPKGKKGR